jgi:hypothetical protein
MLSPPAETITAMTEKTDTPDWDELGRGRAHPNYMQPVVGHADHPAGTGTDESGHVVPDRVRVGLGGSGGWADERPHIHAPAEEEG